MRISSFILRNFKGVNEKFEIKIKKINIFIGPNSSGKSSVIHAMASMAQTVKLSSKRVLILDDEYASVHLGRFIDVLHTSNYNDTMSLGFSIDGINTTSLDAQKQIIYKSNVKCEFLYEFKSTLRTQEISLFSASASVDDHKYFVKKKSASFSLSKEGIDSPVDMQLDRAFQFDRSAIFSFKKSQLAKPDPNQKNTLRFDFLPFFEAQRASLECFDAVRYLGPFRQPPLRRYPTRGSSPTEVGALGENTITMLTNENIKTQKKSHLIEIQKWIGVLGLGKKLNVKREGSSDLFNVSMSLKDGSEHGIADLGYGLSQVLPVLTQCSFSKDGDVLLFEQPELHLHPLAAKNLASIFCDTVTNKDVSLVLETHSSEVISGLCKLIRDGAISKDDVQVIKVRRDKGHSNFDVIDINEDGEIYADFKYGFSEPELSEIAR